MGAGSMIRIFGNGENARMYVAEQSGQSTSKDIWQLEEAVSVGLVSSKKIVRSVC